MKLVFVCVFAGLFPVLVSAGSDGTVALPGSLSATPERPEQGSSVTVKLVVKSSVSMSDLDILFEAPGGCADFPESSRVRRGAQLSAQKEQTFESRAVVKKNGPCKLVASVVRADGTVGRIGWVYAVVLNQAPKVVEKGTPGTDVSGRLTIDAVVK